MVRHEFRTIPLKRNGTGYLIGNYVYIKDRLEGSNLFLRCQKYKTCPARGVIVGTSALDCNDLRHNHAPPDILGMIFRNSLVQMAMDPSNMCLTSKDVYSKGVTAFKKEGLADETRLPSFREVRWAIKCNRIKKVRGWKVYVYKKENESKEEIKGQKQHESGEEPSTSTTPHPTEVKMQAQAQPQMNIHSGLQQPPLSIASQLQQQQQQAGNVNEPSTSSTPHPNDVKIQGQSQPQMCIPNELQQPPLSISSHIQHQQQQPQQPTTLQGDAIIQLAHQQLCGLPNTSLPSVRTLPSVSLPSVSLPSVSLPSVSLQGTSSLLPGLSSPVGIPGNNLPSPALMEGHAIITDFLLVSKPFNYGNNFKMLMNFIEKPL